MGIKFKEAPKGHFIEDARRTYSCRIKGNSTKDFSTDEAQDEVHFGKTVMGKVENVRKKNAKDGNREEF